MAEVSGQQQEITTILGADVHIKGTISFQKGVRVHGHVEGTVVSGGQLHVAREGKVEADVEAGAVIIEGDAKGSLVATDRIELKGTAHLEGDVRAPRLIIETGAIFAGHVSIGPDAAKDRPSAKGAKGPNNAKVEAGAR